MVVKNYTWGRETLQKGKALYSWPPHTNYFRSAAFENANIIYFLTKQATLMRRSAVLKPSSSVSVPCLRHDCQNGRWWIQMKTFDNEALLSRCKRGFKWQKMKNKGWLSKMNWEIFLILKNWNKQVLKGLVVKALLSKLNSEFDSKNCKLRNDCQNVFERIFCPKH